MERVKYDKCCSEALISAWGSFTCRKSTTRDPWLYFPSEGSHTQDFYSLKNPSTPAEIEPANLGSRGECDNHWTTGVDSRNEMRWSSYIEGQWIVRMQADHACLHHRCWWNETKWMRWVWRNGGMKFVPRENGRNSEKTRQVPFRPPWNPHPHRGSHILI